MRITKKSNSIFVEGICSGLLKIGANKIMDVVSKYRTFSLDTIVGKLEVNIDADNRSCYSVFGKFQDVDKAKEKFNCNPHSGKYNFHIGVGTTEEAIEMAIMHFEATMTL